jgi:hypothetical protein
MNKKDLEKLGLTVETLEKAGLEPDVLEQIIVLHGKDIEKWKGIDVENIALKTQLKTASETVEGFKKLDIAGIQKAADDYKAAAEKATTDAELKLAALRFDHALEGELKAVRVKDPADIVPHLKRDMLKLGEDGKLIGLKEQLEPLMEAKPYLFEDEDEEEEEGDEDETDSEEEETEPRIVMGGENHSVLSDKLVDAAREAAGLK